MTQSKDSTTFDVDKNLLKKILGELYSAIYRIGIFDQLSDEARNFAQDHEFIAHAIERGESPRLEPRITLDEARQQVIKMFKVPPSQIDFYNTIITIAYFLDAVEKNPLLVQQIRGVNQMDDLMTQFFGARRS